MTTTIKDVALQAGCSIKTVSRVINNEPFVSAQTREKVLQAIEALDYGPNFSARRLVTRKSFTIGILLHEAGFYQSAILSKMMDISYQHDYDILLQSYFPSHNRSRVKLAQLIHERRVDGLVVTPPCDVDPFLKQLLASEKKKHEQVAYGVSVTTIQMGKGSGQVPLDQLAKHIKKLPKQLTPAKINEVNQRLRALDAMRPKAPIPKGPIQTCLLYTSPSPRDRTRSRMPSSA